MQQPEHTPPIDEATVGQMVEAWMASFRLAQECGSVSAACRRTRCQRSAYYRALSAYRSEGLAGLQELARRCLIRDGDVAERLDDVILELSRAHPKWGRVRVANALRRRGVRVSPSRVRTAWRRHSHVTTREVAVQPTVEPTVEAPRPGSAVAESHGGPGQRVDHFWLAS